MAQSKTTMNGETATNYELYVLYEGNDIITFIKVG
jgi:hypothetical protein